VSPHLGRGLSGALLPVTAGESGPAGRVGWLVLSAVITIMLGGVAAAAFWYRSWRRTADS
jgi:hypothetical protein